MPHSIREKIARSAFFEFGALLEQRAEQPMLTFSLNDKGHLLLNNSKPTRRITSIHAWTNAYLVFISIFVKYHPSRVQEIIKYGDIVRRAASHGGHGWRDYDIQFRLRQQVHPIGLGLCWIRRYGICMWG